MRSEFSPDLCVSDKGTAAGASPLVPGDVSYKSVVASANLSSSAVSGLIEEFAEECACDREGCYELRVFLAFVCHPVNFELVSRYGPVEWADRSDCVSPSHEQFVLSRLSGDRGRTAVSVTAGRSFPAGRVCPVCGYRGALRMPMGVSYLRLTLGAPSRWRLCLPFLHARCFRIAQSDRSMTRRGCSSRWPPC